MQIYVGNLNYRSTEDDIREAFEQFGSVERVQIIIDKETNRPRGFAFVQMPDDTEGRAAIDGLNGKDLQGRSLRVNEALPQEGGARRPPRSGAGTGRGQGGRRPPGR